jgi:tRNA(Arg) A34 adenosine deaminase TadA
MCAQAASFARVARLVFAAGDPKGGGVEHGPRIFEQKSCFHRPVVARVGEAQANRSAMLLRDFFRARR